VGFLAADFLMALRGLAAVEARFLLLSLVLLAFRGFSLVLATASLTALGAVEIISFPASTVALAASVTTSCAAFATSTLAFAASPSAVRVELRKPSRSSIVAPFMSPFPRASHSDSHRVNPSSKKTCAEFEARAWPGFAQSGCCSACCYDSKWRGVP
jgi:hypothetical protein